MKQTDRHTSRQTDRQTGRQAGGHISRQTDILTHQQTDRQTVRHTTRQTDTEMPDKPAWSLTGRAIQTITHWNYKSICRGESSLIQKLYRERIDPTRYISFHGLRCHDVLNGRPVTELIYVHSKMIIVDDRVSLARATLLSSFYFFFFFLFLFSSLFIFLFSFLFFFI